MLLLVRHQRKSARDEWSRQIIYQFWRFKVHRVCHSLLSREPSWLNSNRFSTPASFNIKIFFLPVAQIPLFLSSEPNRIVCRANLHNLVSGDASLMMRNRISDLFSDQKCSPRTHITHKRALSEPICWFHSAPRLGIRNSRHARFFVKIYCRLPM